MPTEAFASPLIVWLGPRRYAFPAGRDVTVGRDSRADIRLDGVGTPASPTHMVLHHDGRQWIAVDRSEGGITSTACGCRRSSSTKVGRSLSAIHSTGPDWCSNSAPRRPRHREPRRRPLLHHHHRGAFNTTDRRFRPHRRARTPQTDTKSGTRPAQPPPLRPPQPPPPPPAATTAQPAPHPGHRKHRRSGRRNHRHHRPPPRQRCRRHTSGRRKHRRRECSRHRNCSQNWCQPFLRPGADGESSSSG